MAVKDVRRIPTTYRAAQWTGLKDGSDDLTKLLDETGADAYFYSDDDYEYGYLTCYGRGAKKTEHYTLSCDMWVVVSSKGKIEVLPDWEYEEKYEDKGE